MEPARRIAGPVPAGQHAVPVLGPAGNNQQPGPLKIVVGGGTLLPLPPTLV
jgi:hypothetical protein